MAHTCILFFLAHKKSRARVFTRVSPAIFLRSREKRNLISRARREENPHSPPSTPIQIAPADDMAALAASATGRHLRPSATDERWPSGGDTSVAATIQTEGVGHMAEGKMTADQKGHLPKRQATAQPAAPAPSVGKDIKLPGGNTISRDRPPILTLAPPNGLKTMAGSDWPEFNDVLLKSTIATVANTDPDALPQRVAAVSAALAAFKPVNEIEGMIAAQAVALHHAAMECLRRAMLPGQTFEVASKLRKDAANMARAMADMLDAMDRKRGKGPQVVRVERVVVHEGGRAIVGNVKAGETAETKSVPPLAIGQEQPALTLDDLVGKQPELVGEGGV